MCGSGRQVCCPASVASSLRASHWSLGAGSKEPSEQMTLCAASFGGGDRFAEQMVDVGFACDELGRPLDEQGSR